MMRKALERERDYLRARAALLKTKKQQLEQQYNTLKQQQIKIAAEHGKVPYTEMKIKITVPTAQKKSSISELERAIKQAVGKKYTVLKCRVDEYNIVAYSDPMGAFYSGSIILTLRVKGDIPVKKGDIFVWEKGEGIPVKGAVLVEIIILILASIAGVVVTARLGGKIIDVVKGFIDEFRDVTPYLLTLGSLFLAGLIWWKIKA